MSAAFDASLGRTGRATLPKFRGIRTIRRFRLQRARHDLWREAAGRRAGTLLSMAAPRSFDSK